MRDLSKKLEIQSFSMESGFESVFKSGNAPAVTSSMFF